MDVETLYTQYAKKIYNYFLAVCNDHYLAEEMTAETFFQAVRSIDKYRGESNILTWLFKIAKHVWYHELEKRKKRHEAELNEEIADNQPLPDDELIDREDKVTLYRRLQQLDQTTRDVMHLHLTGELSFKEIGNVMGQSEGWARITFYRGKERIKKHE